MQALKKKLIEVRLIYLLPVFLATALWTNFEIAKASPLALNGLAPVAIHANTRADYSKDAVDLSFPAIDPAIIDEIRKDETNSAAQDSEPQPGEATQIAPSATPQFSPTSSEASATPGAPTSTSEGGLPIVNTLLPGLPTLPPLPLPTLPIIQTLAPVVPTLLPIVPTLLPIVPTLVPIVPTLVPIVPTLVPVVPTVLAPIATLVPCIPIPFVTSC